MRDEKIIKLFKDGKPDKAFRKLYQYFSKVEKFVKHYGGTTSEAKDLFQDALLITYEKLQTKDFTLTCTVETYVFSICKYKWKDRLSHKNKNVVWEQGNERMLNPESVDEQLYQQKLQTAEKALNTLGDKCLKILELFYYKGWNMTRIAQELDYKTVNAAKTQKYKCLERARKNLDEKILTPKRSTEQLDSSSDFQFFTSREQMINLQANSQ